ncbi:MAG TPA: CsbD family protein [bacterium]|nr:CsbD family protein [bacterium]
MNSDELKGKRRQFRGQIKKEWGKLTDDDLNQVEGNYDILIGKIQEKYATSREEIGRRLDALQASESAPPR